MVKEKFSCKMLKFLTSPFALLHFHSHLLFSNNSNRFLPPLSSKMPKYRVLRDRRCRICRYCQQKIWTPRPFYFNDGSKTAACRNFEKFTGIDVSTDPEYFPIAVCGRCDGGCVKGKVSKPFGDWDVSTPEKEEKVKEALQYLLNTNIVDLKKERMRMKREAQRTARGLEEVDIEPVPDEEGTVIISKTDNPAKYEISYEGNQIWCNIVNLNSMDENSPILNNPIDRYFVRGRAKMLLHETLEAGGKILKINGQYVLVEEEIEVFNLNEIVEEQEENAVDEEMEIAEEEEEEFTCNVSNAVHPWRKLTFLLDLLGENATRIPPIPPLRQKRFQQTLLLFLLRLL